MGLSISKGNAPRRAPHTIDWREIDWKKVWRSVKELQTRIAEGTTQRRWRQVRNLQRLLAQSYSARLLAVRYVTEKAGRRTPGVDGETWRSSEEKAKAAQRMRKKGYRPKPVKRIYIPKSHGKGRRGLGIPCMLDRAMQTLYKLTLEPIAETCADPNSYGFRPGRSVHDAINQCRTVLDKKNSARYVLCADIAGCFDHISHEWILKHVPLPMKILRQWLKAGYWERKTWHPTETGVPQGGSISPCITNWVLDGLEKE